MARRKLVNKVVETSPQIFWVRRNFELKAVILQLLAFKWSSCIFGEKSTTDLKQGQGRRHLKVKFRVSIILSRLFQVILLVKCVLAVLAGLIWF